MPVEITNASNLQELEIEISGPSPATKLFIVTGTTAGLLSGQKQAYTLHVGPPLTSSQFVKAIAMVAPVKMQLGPNQDHGFHVASADADFDDDNGKTELRFEVQQYGAATEAVAFHVTILAAL